MWRATLLASVLVLVLASFHVLLAGGVGPGVTDRTLEQVSEPGSSGQAGTLSFGKESTDCVVECQCDGATDVYTPRRDHHSERTREDTPPRHVLDSAPLSDLYRNRHFFDRATESTSREQRWSSILSVLGAINRAETPFHDLYQWHFIVKRGAEYRCNDWLPRNADATGHFITIRDAFGGKGDNSSDDHDNHEHDGVFLFHLKDGGWYTEEISVADPRVPNLTFPVFAMSRHEGHDLIGRNRQRKLLMPPYARHMEKLDLLCDETEDLTETKWREMRDTEKVFGWFRERCGNQGSRELIDGETFEECERFFVTKMAQAHPDLLDIHPVGEDTWNLTAVTDRVEESKFDTGYVFVIATNGLGGDYGVPRKLSSNTVVFYTKPTFKQILDEELVPWRHYVPVLEESSDDLLRNFNLLQREPGLAWRIARNGRDLACARLRREPRMTWFRHALRFVHEIMGDVPSWQDIEEKTGALHSCLPTSHGAPGCALAGLGMDLAPAQPSTSVATGGSDRTDGSGKDPASGTCHLCGGSLKRGNVNLARKCLTCKTRYHATDCGKRRSNAGYAEAYDQCPKCARQCKCVGGDTNCHTSTVRLARNRKREAAASGDPAPSDSIQGSTGTRNRSVGQAKKPTGDGATRPEAALEPPVDLNKSAPRLQSQASRSKRVPTAPAFNGLPVKVGNETNENERKALAIDAAAPTRSEPLWNLTEEKVDDPAFADDATEEDMDWPDSLLRLVASEVDSGDVGETKNQTNPFGLRDINWDLVNTLDEFDAFHPSLDPPGSPTATQQMGVITCAGPKRPGECAPNAGVLGGAKRLRRAHSEPPTPGFGVPIATATETRDGNTLRVAPVVAQASHLSVPDVKRL